MNDRLDKLGEFSLVSRILAARQMMDDLKQVQRFGSSSVKTDRVFSANTWDITLTGMTSTLRKILVTYTPDDTTLDTLGLVHSMKATYSNSPYIFPSIWIERNLPVNNIQTWTVYCSGTGTPSSISFKFYFFTNGHGSFTANEI